MSDRTVTSIQRGRLREAFRLIGRCRAGRCVLEAFIPRFQSGQVELEWVDEGSTLLQTLLPSGAGRRAVSGAFVWVSRERQKVILEAHPEPVVQAAILLHEMVHATDARYLESFAESERLWNAFRARAEEELALASSLLGKRPEEVLGEDLTRAARLDLARRKRVAELFDARRLVAAEKRAYLVVTEWITELQLQHPETRARIALAQESGYRFDYVPSERELLDSLGVELEAA